MFTLGFRNKMAAVSCIPDLDEDQQHALALAVLTVHRQLTYNMQERFIKGELRIPCGHQLLKGAIRWMPAVWQLHALLSGQTIADFAAAAKPSSEAINAELRLQFTCPSCAHRRSARSAPFQMHYLRKAKSIKCQGCRIVTPVCLWRCPCELQWTHCTVHTQVAFQPGDAMPPKPKPRKRVQVDSRTPDEVARLTKMPKTVSRKHGIYLPKAVASNSSAAPAVGQMQGIQASSLTLVQLDRVKRQPLGPKLAAKFAHLFTP